MNGDLGTASTVLQNISVIIPVVEDHEHLKTLLSDLRTKSFGQLIVACGDESSYDFLDLEKVTFIRANRGRGRQIQAGIEQANLEWVWVLHADTRVSKDVVETLAAHIQATAWGAFKVALLGKSALLRIIGALINWRSRWTSIYTGDQGMFFRRDLLYQTDGFPPFDLLEDVECSRRLRRIKRGVQLPAKLHVSARKWERDGIMRTVFQMWLYRFLYFVGTSPNELARRYYNRSN